MAALRARIVLGAALVVAGLLMTETRAGAFGPLVLVAGVAYFGFAVHTLGRSGVDEPEKPPAAK